MDLKTSCRILERPLPAKGKSVEVNFSVFALLYAETVRYLQNRSEGIEDLETKLAGLGKSVGTRLHRMYCARERPIRRENRLLNVLYYLHHTMYRAIFGKPADSLERSNECPDEYMVIDLEPVTAKFISLPKDLSQLCCSAFIAGILEAILESLDFPAKISAHLQPTDAHLARTVFLIKFAESVMAREQSLAAGAK